MNENNDEGRENLAGDFLTADTTETTNTNIAGRKRAIGQTDSTIAALEATTASALNTTTTNAQRPPSSSSSQQQQSQNQHLNPHQQNPPLPQQLPQGRHYRLSGGGCSAVDGGGGVGSGSGSISNDITTKRSKTQPTSSSSSQQQTRPVASITPLNAGITQIHMLLISLFIRHEYFTTC